MIKSIKNKVSNCVNQLWFDFMEFVPMSSQEEEPKKEQPKEMVYERELVGVCESESKPTHKKATVAYQDDYDDYTPQPQEERFYKHPIDKKLLKEMLTDIDCKSPNMSAYIKELNKLCDVIFNKHFSKYYTMKEDLEGDAVLAVYNKRKYYNPEKDAYNFLYAIMRNEMTNKLSKLNRITLVDDYMPYDNAIERRSTDDMDDIPQNVLKWSDYMVGDIEFNWVKIPRKEVLELMVWLKLHERGQHPKITIVSQTHRRKHKRIIQIT